MENTTSTAIVPISHFRYIIFNESEYESNTIQLALYVEQFRGFVSFVVILGTVLTLLFLMRKRDVTAKKRNNTSGTRIRNSLSFFVTLAVGVLLLLNIASFAQVIIAWVEHDTFPSNLAYNSCDVAVLVVVYLYVIISWSTYIVMFLRASAVLDKTVTERWIVVLKGMVGFGTLCAPLFMLLIYLFGDYRGTVMVMNDVHYCYMGSDTSLNALFVVCDTAISLGYLVLFIYPVIVTARLHKPKSISQVDQNGTPTHAQRDSKSADVNSSLMKVARKNLKWSMLTVGVTFFSVGLGVVSAVLSERNVPEGAFCNSLYFVLAGVIDLTVKTVATLAISNNVPKLYCSSRSTRSSKATIIHPCDDTSGTITN